MDRYEYKLKDCPNSVQVFYEELKNANIEGLCDKVYCKEVLYLVIMPGIAEGNVDSGHNIFIDIEEWGAKNEEKNIPASGEVTFNYGYGHWHTGYGDNYPIEECAKDIAGLVKDIQNKEIYAFGLVSPIGSIRSGYRNLPEFENFTIRQDFQFEYIRAYYKQNIYKEGMPEEPVDVEIIRQIVEVFEKQKKKEMLSYSFWNEMPQQMPLFDDFIDGGDTKNETN